MLRKFCAGGCYAHKLKKQLHCHGIDRCLVWLDLRHAVAAISIEGQVQGGGAPIANSTVTLWSASANAPSQLSQVKTDTNGQFQISVDQSMSDRRTTAAG